MRSKRIAIRRRRRRRAPSRRTNAPSALPRCSRHCSPILLRAAAATAHRRGAPKTMMMMMMMMIHASLSHKIDFGFFSCVWNSLSLSSSSKLFGGNHTQKKKKKNRNHPRPWSSKPDYYVFKKESTLQYCHLVSLEK
tara:strand:+ start:1725 stop:2135 length:411 start_codon:yes stop_codon:yes gene_type:complete